MGSKSNIPQSTSTKTLAARSKTPSKIPVTCRKSAEKSPPNETSKPVAVKEATRANATKSPITKSEQPKKVSPKSRNPPKVFNAVVPSGTRLASRRRHPNCEDFAYHLSNKELQFLGNCKQPMKEVPANERYVLKHGQRETYLNMRYTYAPDDKYNFPEATSWRIGWFHKNNAQSCHNII